MATTTVRIKGTLTPDGEIQVTLPDDWQLGEVEILVQTTASNDETMLLDFEGKQLGDIVTGGWEGMNVDGLAWSLEQRHQDRHHTGE